jgi:RNA polymerase sigma-70 factor (ECF subfamily)
MRRLAHRLGGPQSGHEDIVQDALAVAWGKRAQYDASKGTPTAWLLAITANVAFQHHRTRRQQEKVAVEVSRSEPIRADRTDVTEDLAIAAAIESLPPRQRLAVTCFYFVGLNVQHTAEVLGCSQGTVKSTLHDARKRLRSILGDD